MSCGADGIANQLLEDLLAGKDFSLPTINMDDDVFDFPDFDESQYPMPEPITDESLTTTQLDGTGTFDKLMRAITAHLNLQFEKTRITGPEYAKTYTAIVTSVLGAASQFVLSKDAARWSALAARNQAKASEVALVEARVRMEQAKLQYQMTRIQAETVEVEYASSKLNLANIDINYCISKFQLEKMLPLDEDLKEAQLERASIEAEAALAQVQDLNSDGQPFGGLVGSQLSMAKVQEEVAEKQLELTQEQIDAARVQTKNTLSDGSAPAGMAKVQIDSAKQQLELLEEQTDSARAQTKDTLDSGDPVTGLLGKQKNLLEEQKQSYIKDAAVKAARLYVDSFITQKGMDEGFPAPDEFKEAALQEVLVNIRELHDLD